MIEAITYRRKGHAEHDNQSYQPPDEIAQWEERDPVDAYVRRLTDSGWATEEELAEIDARVADELQAALTESESADLPAGETALSDVYTDPNIPNTPLWFRRLDG